MGTNYYLEPKAPCECCGRSFEQLHIGKSSAGWVFALHVHPDEKINDLPDWVDKWRADGARIVDEYGKVITPDEMVSIILARFGRRDKGCWSGRDLMMNQAVDGPYGLARSMVDGHRVVGHGLGTYDLHTGDFS